MDKIEELAKTIVHSILTEDVIEELINQELNSYISSDYTPISSDNPLIEYVIQYIRLRYIQQFAEIKQSVFEAIKDSHLTPEQEQKIISKLNLKLIKKNNHYIIKINF